MHSTCFVALPGDAPQTEEALYPFLRSYLLPYWSQLEVEPYEDGSYSAEETAKIAALQGFGTVEEFARSLDTHAEEGVRDGRYYQISTYNANSEWDYFVIQAIGALRELREQWHPYSVVDSKRMWRFQRHYGCRPLLDFHNSFQLHPDNVEPQQKWLLYLEEFYSQNTGHAFAVLDVHS